MPTATAQRDDVVLTCSPEKTADTIVINYGISNRGRAPVYVADAMPRIDSATKTVAADPDAVTIWRGANNHAHVLKGLAALPTDRMVFGRVYPLMARIEPGAALDRVLTIALPMAEHSPYFSVTNLRSYRLTDIEGITVAIDMVVARAPEPQAVTVDYAPELFAIPPAEMLARSQRLACSFSAKGLHLMMRTDTYPRPD
ncbi:MAG: hypothetical protein IT555_00030 [Acetobacteraceae bacterium]|nr:hypothetical protein [Acetobacteraceae bacterium]